MNGDHRPGSDPWWYSGGGDGSSVDMFNAHTSTDDLLELVWQAGGEGDGTGQPAVVSCCLLSSPPCEDVMAAWLYPILSGQDLDGADCLKEHPVAKETSTMAMRTPTTESKGKLPVTDGTAGAKDTKTRSDSGEKKKASGRGSSGSRKGSSRHSATHNTAEKRRRCKINERLRTLQQLVPGCDKSNQASTLEQTIRYMKSLQQHVLQAMNTTLAVAYPVGMPMPPTVAAAVAPGMVIPPAGMVQPVAMLPYPHHRAVMMPAAPWYPPAPPLPLRMQDEEKRVDEIVIGTGMDVGNISRLC